MSRTYVFLGIFVIFLASVFAQDFSVGLVVQPLLISLANYTQTEDAFSNGNSSEITIYGQYVGNGTSPLSITLPAYLSAALNASILEDGQAIATTYAGGIVQWTGNLSTSPRLALTVPPPQITLGNETRGALYTLPMTLTALTVLQNASFTVNVPPGYAEYVLMDLTLGAPVDRTREWDLSVDDTTVSFTNVEFPIGTLSRNVELSAVAVSYSSTSSGSTKQYSYRPLIFSVPDKLSAPMTESVTEYMTVTNPDLVPQTVHFTVNSPEVSLEKKSITVRARGTESIALTYAPLLKATSTSATVKATTSKESSVFTIALTPLPAPDRTDISLSFEGDSLIVDAQSTRPVTIELTLENENGTIIPVGKPQKFDGTITYDRVIDVNALSAGIWRACATATVDSLVVGKRCVQLFDRPSSEEPGSVAGTDSTGNNSWPVRTMIFVIGGSLALLALGGTVFWLVRRA